MSTNLKDMIHKMIKDSKEHTEISLVLSWIFIMEKNGLPYFNIPHFWFLNMIKGLQFRKKVSEKILSYQSLTKSSFWDKLKYMESYIEEDYFIATSGTFVQRIGSKGEEYLI